ncbi:MAG: hypothetical protein LKK00_05770 [Intestinimonas sp.]|jgi:hypothetical protein|nr:hypothetical protein [Intestinimonas sp.]
MTEEIMALARSLGGLGEEEDSRLLPLCQAAEAELTGRLREGIAPEDCAQAFSLAAAWLALADRSAGQETDGVTGFTAGSFTVRREGGEARQAVETLRRRAEAILAPWLKDGGFAFQGVVG